MYEQVEKPKENKTKGVANSISQEHNATPSTFQFVDNRPEAISQRKLQEIVNNSPQVKQALELQQYPIQKKKNNTSLPDNLKSGIENLSGQTMDDVKVHYNSAMPAQLNAHAYAQGTDIHLSSGQEKHLPHEAWHIVQQKQGRVKPTMQMKGQVNINDDAALEKEADVMGAKALDSAPSPSFVKLGTQPSIMQQQKIFQLADWNDEMKQQARALYPAYASIHHKVSEAQWKLLTALLDVTPAAEADQAERRALITWIGGHTMYKGADRLEQLNHLAMNVEPGPSHDITHLGAIFDGNTEPVSGGAVTEGKKGAQSEDSETHYASEILRDEPHMASPSLLDLSKVRYTPPERESGKTKATYHWQKRSFTPRSRELKAVDIELNNASFRAEEGKWTGNSPNGAYGRILKAFQAAQEHHPDPKHLAPLKTEQWDHDSTRRKGVRMLTEDTIAELRETGSWKGAGVTTIAESIRREREKAFKKECDLDFTQQQTLTRELQQICRNTYPLLIRKAMEKASNFHMMLRFEDTEDLTQFLETYKKVQHGEQGPNSEKTFTKKPPKKKGGIDYYKTDTLRTKARSLKFENARKALKIIAMLDISSGGGEGYPSWYEGQLAVIDHYEREELTTSYEATEAHLAEGQRQPPEGSGGSAPAAGSAMVWSKKADSILVTNADADTIFGVEENVRNAWGMFGNGNKLCNVDGQGQNCLIQGILDGLGLTLNAADIKAKILLQGVAAGGGAVASGSDEPRPEQSVAATADKAEEGAAPPAVSQGRAAGQLNERHIHAILRELGEAGTDVFVTETTMIATAAADGVHITLQGPITIVEGSKPVHLLLAHSGGEDSILGGGHYFLIK